MAVTTKKTFNAVGSGGQGTTTFTPVGIELNNQDDLDVYVTLSGGTRVLQYNQSTGSTTDSNHPQVNDTTGLYFPAQSAGVTLYNYTISTDNNTITFNSALPTDAVVTIERRTRDSSSNYTNFTGGSTIRHTDINKAFDESNFTAQEARNKAFDIEGKIFDGASSLTFVKTSSLVDDAVTYPKIQNVSATDRVLGRDSAGAGVIEEIAPAALRTMINVEDGATADQTSAEIRTAVGAANDSNVYTDAHNTLVGGITSTAAEINKLDGFSGTTADLNIVSGMTKIESTATYPTTSDTAYPTAKSINAHIIDIVNDVGGFVPIPNEVSFPNAHPDPDDGVGTIVSIADAGGVVVDGSGVSTTGRTLGGATVTINGIDSSLNSSTIAAGKGMLVQTTTTLNTYTYHRLVVDEAGVANAQTLVTDFNGRYKVAGSAPTASVSEGDLWYDTGNDEMKVYDATLSAFKAISSTGNYSILELRNAANNGNAVYDGSIKDYTLVTKGTTTAINPNHPAQLIVSLNGVIQEPNTGTSTPTNGFALNGSTIKFSNNLASGTAVFIVRIGATVDIGTPTNNTVTSAHIVNGTIVDADIAGDTISESKLDIHNAPSGTDKFLKYTANGMEWAVDNNTVYTHPNHSGEVTSTADGATVIADNIVDEANLKVSNAPTNGYVLTAQSGNTGGMTWEVPAAGATGGNSNLNGVFWENQQTVTHDYTIQNNYNAGSFGPITINSGITVTVGAGESWTVI